MLKINKDVEYALIAFGALEMDRTVSIREIAESHHIPYEKLSKIFQKLSKAGIVKAHYGVHGGYEPAKSIEQVSLLDIVNALYSQLSIVPCIKNTEACSRFGSCTIHSGISTLQKNLEQNFKSLTLKDLL